MHTYAVSPRVEFLVSLPDGLVWYTLPFCNTLAAQKPPAGSTEPVHAPIPPIPSYTALNRTSRAGLRTVRAILNAGWNMLLSSLSFILTTNFSAPILSDVLRALQTLRSFAPVTLPAARDSFLGPHFHRPCVIAALEESQDASPVWTHARFGIRRRMWRRTTATGTWPPQFGVLTGAHRPRAFPSRNAWYKQFRGTVPHPRRDGLCGSAGKARLPTLYSAVITARGNASCRHPQRRMHPFALMEISTCPLL